MRECWSERFFKRSIEEQVETVEANLLEIGEKMKIDLIAIERIGHFSVHVQETRLADVNQFCLFVLCVLDGRKLFSLQTSVARTRQGLRTRSESMRTIDVFSRGTDKLI